MKLVLCSEGFATPNTVEACVDLCEKPQDEVSIAIINEAYAPEEGDKRWVIDNICSVARYFPGEIDIVNLLALPIAEVEKRLQAKDVIFNIGGDPDYLVSLVRRTGFDAVLARLLQTKVYVGSSAASMIMGKRISDKAYQLLYGHQNRYEAVEYLGHVDFSIVPHLGLDDKVTLAQAVGSFAGKVYGLQDDSAVVVNGQEIYMTGSDPAIING